MAALVNMVAQLAFTAVLARQLDPAVFGIMLMAIVATRFASYFALLGGAQTLIQAPAPCPELTTAMLLSTLCVSVLLYGCLLFCAPLFAWYFHSPELVQVLAVFGLTLPLAAVGALPMALLRRRGRFGVTTVIEVLAYVIGYGLTAVTLASQGHGVWSLVAGALVQQSIVLGMGAALGGYPLLWPVPRSAWRQAFGRGGRYSLIGFLEFLWANVESMLIGRALGQAQLGLLNRAQQLSNLPTEQAVNTTTKVLFPALSAMQRDRTRLGDGFLILLLGTGIVSAALAGGLMAAAPDAVALLLGTRWGDAVPLVYMLAAALPPMFAYVACGVALDSVAALRTKLILQGSMLPVKIGALLLVAPWGLQAIVVAAAGCEFLRAALGLRHVARLLRLEWRELWRVLRAICAVAVTVFLAAWSARAATDALAAPLWARVAAEVLTGGLALATWLGLSLQRWMEFAPLQRFESLRTQLARAHRFLHRTVRP